MSFSTFFSSPATSLAQLRVALERLVSIISPTTTQDSSYKPLHKKISELSSRHERIVRPMLAVKYLGNFGAHGGIVKESDVRQAYEIFSIVLIQLFNPSSIQEDIDKINENKGPIS